MFKCGVVNPCRQTTDPRWGQVNPQSFLSLGCGPRRPHPPQPPLAPPCLTWLGQGPTAAVAQCLMISILRSPSHSLLNSTGELAAQIVLQADHSTAEHKVHDLLPLPPFPPLPPPPGTAAIIHGSNNTPVHCTALPLRAACCFPLVRDWWCRVARRFALPSQTLPCLLAPPSRPAAHRTGSLEW